MPVIERPSKAMSPVTCGTVIVFCVDPVASVAQLNDEQATREAAALIPCKYLALYDDVSREHGQSTSLSLTARPRRTGIWSTIQNSVA